MSTISFMLLDMCLHVVYVICKFCIHQEVLSPSIESIQTYVDNLAALNSRYFNHFILYFWYMYLRCQLTSYLWLDFSCREETKEHEDDEASEKTNPRKSLEEEYLETEKKVRLSNLAWFYTHKRTQKKNSNW